MSNGAPPETETVLIEMLLTAVPLWVNDLSGCTTEQLRSRAARCSAEIAAHGDDLMFKGKTREARRNTASAFNALAEGLACGAYVPGGITFAGYHWCVGSAHWGIPQDRTGPCEQELERTAGTAA